MKLGILGGTFNPVHNGHLKLAKEIKKEFELDKIYFIPTNIPVHKVLASSVSIEDRVRMLELALENEKDFEIDTCDIIRGGITYTKDTLFCLNSKFPKANLYLIMGDDLFVNFHTWKEPQKIVELAKIIVAKRQNFKLESNFEHLVASNFIYEVSSSQIRERLKNRQEIESLVGAKVASYIKEKGLYLD